MAGAINVNNGICVEWKVDDPLYCKVPYRSPDISFMDSNGCLEFTRHGMSKIFLRWCDNSSKTLRNTFKVTTYVECRSISYALQVVTTTVKNSGNCLWSYVLRVPYPDSYFTLGGFNKDGIKFICALDFTNTHVKKAVSTQTLDGSDGLQSLSHDFSIFREDGTFSDVKLKCGDRTFSAHTAVLAARSEVFAAMFRNEMAERKTGVVDIKDLDADVLQLLLEYMYSGKEPDVSPETARSLYVAADKYAVHALRKTCSERMIAHMTKNNCLEMLVLADEHSDEVFKESVTSFVAEHFKSFSIESWTTFKKEYSHLAVAVLEKRLTIAIPAQS